MPKAFLPQIPANGPAWLLDFANSIADLFRRILPAPLRPPQYATAGLPDPAEWTGAVVYNLTTKRHYYSDGSSWIELATVAEVTSLATSPTAVPYATGWGDFGGGFQGGVYMKSRDGRVSLGGLILNGGTGGATLFTLPAGFHPAATRVCGVIANSAVGRIDISTAGVATLISGSGAAWISLEGISFYV